MYFNFNSDYIYFLFIIGSIVYFNSEVHLITANVSLITSDLVTLTSCNDTSAECFPMPAAFLSACDDPSSSLTELLNGNLNNNLVDLAALNSKLTDIYMQIASLPDYSHTASYLYNINRKYLFN
jgi:hypothetical protein